MPASRSCKRRLVYFTLNHIYNASNMSEAEHEDARTRRDQLIQQKMSELIDLWKEVGLDVENPEQLRWLREKVEMGFVGEEGIDSQGRN